LYEYDNLIDFHNQDWTITLVVSNSRNDKVQDNMHFDDFIKSLRNNNIEKLPTPTPPIIPPKISEDKKILDFLQK